jgi:ubiquinone/menaquinone biosynthesis C-methylase UbiE
MGQKRFLLFDYIVDTKIMTETIFEQKQKFFDRWAVNYDCLLTTVFYQAVHRRMLEFVTLSPQPNLLDLGCGTGRLLSRLAANFPHLKGIGLDLSPEMLNQARKNNQFRSKLIFIRGNVDDLPFAEGQFEAVFNTISFLHYPDPERVLLEVYRVLEKGGKFYLADYCAGEIFPRGFFPFSPGGLRFYSRKQRDSMGKKAGFKNICHHYLLNQVVLTIFEK